ncbi:cadherin EGF LAG seven-pass G-type receptor 2-like [Glandiceps talaboti]
MCHFHISGAPHKNNNADLLAVVPPGFDYETETQYVLTVTAVDYNDPSVGTVTATLTLDITDEIDPPQFTNLPGVGSVSELATTPVTWHLVTATDDDSPPTDITFSISGSDPPVAPFQIGAVIYNPGDAVVEIQNAPNPGFDYETQSTTPYELYITATDDGGLETTSTLTIFVYDENEDIALTNLPDTVVLSEAALGFIYQVEWSDEDSLDPGTPSFTISTAPSGGPFSINATGAILVTSPGLNYVEEEFWTISVYIEDPDGLTDNEELYVQVIDVDLGPVITNMPTGVSVQLGELTSGGYDIFTVEAVEYDGDDYFCVLFVNPNDGNFEMNSTTKVIRLIDSPTLDYETLPTYTLTVTCHDYINAGAPRELIVNLIDENEPPEILNLPDAVTVPEDAINMAAIFDADGFDVDGDDLTYHIDVTPGSGLGKFFFVDTTANDAKIKIPDNPGFDFESIGQYIIVLEATDGEFTATGTLTVNIVDTDEPPHFVDTSQHVYITEDQAIGTILPVNWAATDVDTPPTSLVYSMVSGSYSSYFTFTNSGPQLSIAQLMDYEANFPEPFVVRFSVADPEGGKGYLNLKVHLQNVNDNSPIFTQTLYTGTVYEMEYYGSSILQVSAVDGDLADVVTYSINPVNPYFDIDPVTGEVTVKQLVNRATVGEFVTFTVVATDNGSPSLQDTSTVTITLIDINDNAPSFSKSFWNWEIRYDADIATYVNSVTATDPDVDKSLSTAGQNGAITYMVYTPNSNFDMASNGKVTVQGNLNPEQKYLMTCYAQDGGTPPETSDVSTIRIDTFIPQLVLADVYLGISVDEFTPFRQRQFLDELNTIYDPWQFRISAIRSSSAIHTHSATSRRLLHDYAVAEVYALTNDNTDDQGNIGMVKDFVYYEDLVSAMTRDPDGTPSTSITGTEFDNFPIVKVEPTYDVTSDDFNWWLDTVEGNVTIGVLASIIPLALLMCLAAFCCWKYRCCQRCASYCCRRSKKPEQKVRPKTPIERVRRPDKVPQDANPPYSDDKFDLRYANRPHGKMFGGPLLLAIPTTTAPFGQNVQKKSYEPLIIAPSQPKRNPTSDNYSRLPSRSSISTAQTELSDGGDVDKVSEGSKITRTYHGHPYSSSKTPLKHDYDTYM